jgi:hypothetical protein
MKLTKSIRGGREFLGFWQSYRDYLQDSLSLSQAHEIVSRGLIERHDNFLRMLKENVFDNPSSPYLPLMRAAHCELGDVQKIISQAGLERALVTLRKEGVYFSFEEYKGRVPVVRSGQEIPVNSDDFRSANLAGIHKVETGGSTGAAMQIGMRIDHVAALVPARMLAFEANGLRGLPSAIWMGVFPDHSGPNNILRGLKSGQVPLRWFANVVTPDGIGQRLRAKIYNRAIVDIGRFSGNLIPRPERLNLNEAIVAAQWISDTLKSCGKCFLYCHVSKGVRVAVAAADASIDLTGATFVLAGEPVTPGKVAAITRAGGRVVPVYAFSEHGSIGFGCANSIFEDEVHVCQDTIEVIQHPRKVPGHDIEVEALHLTSLSPTAPNILINVETDDCGVIEDRDCGCQMQSYGFRKHISHIRSFQKLTGEGVTLIGSDAIRALEEVLPARFGGSPLDYQLIEEEQENGLTCISLVIDPKVSIESDRDVIETFVTATGYHDLQQVWNSDNSLRVRRQKPILTERGKMNPIHVLK